MFKPAKIAHFRAYIPAHKRAQILSLLSETGICELNQIDTRDFRYTNEESAGLALSKRLFRLLDIIPEPKKKQSFVASLLEKLIPKKAPFRNDEELIAHIEEELSVFADDLLSLHARKEEIKTLIENNKLTLQHLEYMPDVLLSSFEATEHYQSIYGVVRTKSVPQLTEELPQRCVYSVSKVNKLLSFVVVMGFKEEMPDIERSLHKSGIDVFSVPHVDKMPKQLRSDIIMQSRDLEAELVGIDNKLQDLSDIHSHTLTEIAEDVEALKVREMGHRLSRGTEGFSAFEAWVPEKDITTFVKCIESVTEKNYYLEKSTKNESAPTVYDNNGLVRPFEVLTTTYSAPKANTFDPTPILAITFPLFFGFMLTDVVYGLLLLGFGLALYLPGWKRFGDLGDMAGLITTLGLFTTVLGVVFGSYFGNFFQELGYNVPALLDPMEDIVILLGITVILGVLHISSGLIAGFIENLRAKKIKEACGDQLVWILFVAGIIAVTVLQGAMPIVWGSLMGAAVLIQLVIKFMEGGPVISVLSLSDFMGFIGDTCSYSRLMAMAIGTAGIALAVNFLAMLVTDMIPVVGIVLGVIIFIGGHLFNFAMNGLGSMVHAMRLHYLEHFSKYYEGGGKVYTPFYSNRKFTEVEVK